MTLKFAFFLGATSVFFVSCSGDDNTFSTVSEVGISHFTETYKHVTSFGDQIQFSTDYVLDGNRFQSMIAHSYENGVEVSSVTSYPWSYVDGRMVSEVFEVSNARHFFYDSQGRMIGADRVTEGLTIYARFTPLNGNAVLCERLNAPYSDSNAQVLSRAVMDFDNEGNLMSAGLDANNDGVADNPNIFAFQDGNYTSVQLGSGAIVNFSYDSMKDSKNLIYKTTYGSKNFHLLCFENLASSSAGMPMHSSLLSELLNPAADSPEFEYLADANSYVKTKRKTEASSVAGIQLVFEIEYFFE